MRIPKAVPVVRHGKGDALDILVFAHHEAATQVVKGTVETCELVAEAARRELFEGAGISGTTSARDLGTWEQCSTGQVLYFRELSVSQALPESWEQSTSNDGGHRFVSSGLPLGLPAPQYLSPCLLRCIRFRGQASGSAVCTANKSGCGAA